MNISTNRCSHYLLSDFSLIQLKKYNHPVKLRTMYNKSKALWPAVSPIKAFRRDISMKGDVHLSNRRAMRKIRPGKARPAIFHQFESLVELSDGSVIVRRTQAPKDEIRMISDQRNSQLWNPHRSDLVSLDPNATGKLNRFKQRFAGFEVDDGKPDSKDQSTTKEEDDLIRLMGANAIEVQSGGKVADKNNKKKK